MDIERTATALLVAAALIAAGTASADHRDDTTTDSRGRYATARVIDVDPIVRVVRVSEPRRTCWDEDYIVEAPRRGRHQGTAGNTILGGIIGGAIGNAFGDGRGRDAATVAGVLIGSSIAHDRAVERNAEADRYGSRDRVRTRTRCDVDEVWHEEERIEGYYVTYEYLGERYRSRMSHDPGAELKVWVSVQPVGE